MHVGDSPEKECGRSGPELKRAVEEAPRRLNSAVKIIRMIAEMPASTHAVDQALCREWLDDNKDWLR